MDPRTLTRRELLRLAGGALGVPIGVPLAASLASPLAALAASGCGVQAPERLAPARAADDAPRARPADPGVQPLGLGGERDGAAARCDVAPGRVATAGFSDGATYALALGRANGDRVSHVLAFSPGFLIPARRVGAPRIFVSHGRQDDVLPIASCSRVMAPRLQRDGYEVRYREFDGGHEAPPTVMREGVGFFLDGGG
jgi:phospholipase/carboxylesterase